MRLAFIFAVLQVVRGGAPADSCGGCGAGGQPGGARPGHRQPPRPAQPQVSSSSLQPSTHPPLPLKMQS